MCPLLLFEVGTPRRILYKKQTPNYLREIRLKLGVRWRLVDGSLVT